MNTVLLHQNMTGSYVLKLNDNHLGIGIINSFSINFLKLKSKHMNRTNAIWKQTCMHQADKRTAK